MNKSSSSSAFKDSIKAASIFDIASKNIAYFYALIFSSEM